MTFKASFKQVALAVAVACPLFVISQGSAVAVACFTNIFL
jgi:hypothetical protein